MIFKSIWMTTNDRGADVALQDPLVWGDFRDALDILVWELRMEQFNHLFPGILDSPSYALMLLVKLLKPLKQVFGACNRLVFSALSNLFLLHWRWRATHHTPLQEFTRRLQFWFYAFDLLALGINAEGSGQLGIHAAHLWWSSWAVQWKLGTFSNFLIIIRLPW